MTEEKQIEKIAEEILILQEYTDCYSEVDKGCLINMLGKLVSEVARGIFEELETSLVIGGFVDGKKYIAIREDDYNHYKKKYTEEGK